MKKLFHRLQLCCGTAGRTLSVKRISTLVLMLMLAAPLSAANLFAQKTVTLSMRDVSLEQFFEQIKSQTGDIIMYSDDEIDVTRRISVTARNENVTQVLSRVLNDVGLAYRIVDDYVLIYKPQPPAQQPIRTLTGKITSLSGEPLVGASIVVAGTISGTASDAEGRYSLTFQSADPLIRVSYLGYKTKEERLGNRSVIDFVLIPDDTKIDDVIVTGFFTRQAESFTGSVNTITNEQLMQANPTNLLSALSIVEPSFKMVENITDGSNPNVIPEFQIRGSSSLPSTTAAYQGSPNMPTFMLDGFEVTAEKVFDLDPTRVESITILKDAAATAIYGSRAANGVVVITTKVAQGGKIDVVYNVDLSLTYPDLSDYNLLNAREKVDLEIASGYFNLIDNNAWNEMVKQELSYRHELLARGNDTYWLNKPLRNALAHKHSLSVEGGEGALRFSLDVGLEEAPGVMKESGRTRKSMGVTLQYTISDKLVLRNQTTYGDVIAENSPYGSFSIYATLNPYYAIYDDDGNYLYWLENGSRTVPNPLFNTTLNTIDRTRYNEWLNNFSASWWITPKLHLKGTFSLSHRDDEGTFFRSANHTDFGQVSSDQISRAGVYNATDGRSFNYDASLVLSYNNTFGKHFLNANAVMQIQENTSESYTIYMEGFPDDNLDYLSFALDYSGVLPTALDDKSRSMGFVGSANYSYDNRFLADFSLRLDASSRFGADSRWAPFWAVGAGWNIHNEKFMQPIRFISSLRLRATYGYTGSQRFDPYQAMTMYKYNLSRRYLTGVGASMMGIGNDKLKWQENRKTNLGIDVNMFDDRLSLRFDWYNDKSTNLLTDITLAPSLGFSSYKDNLGDVQNRGWEASARVTVFKRESAYVNVSVAATRNRNKLLKLSESLAAWNAVGDGEEDGNDKTNRPRVRYVEGQSLNTIWGLRSLGINPTTGREIFLTREGTLTDKWESKNQIPIGINEADLEGNIGINAGYKGFLLNAYFSYRIGGQIYNETLVARVENSDNRLNTDRRVLDQRWQNPGDVTYFKQLRSTDPTQSTSRFVNDYNYLTLSSLSLSYDFDREWIKAAGMKGLRLTFSMNDIFRSSTVKQERGIEYPFSRTARMSLRVSF